MKKYVFRLETVRRVRKAQEDNARAQLLAANGEVQKAIDAVEARTAECDNRAINLHAPVSVDQFMKGRYFNELSGKAVIAATASRRAAELEAAAKRDLWTEAAKRVRALDRLDDRRRAEHALELQRQLDSEADDIVTGRFMRKSS